MNQTKKMKKGITLIEIILAIVLIAIILGITIPKLMSNSQQAEIKSVISHDVRAIMEAAALWRKQTVAANGSFQDLSASNLRSILPSNMDVDVNTGLIYSTGFRTGDTVAGTNPAIDDRGVHYTVRWHFNAANIDLGTFSIGMNFTRGDTELGWDNKIRVYASETFANAVTEVATRANGAAPALWTTDVAQGNTAGAMTQTVVGAIPCSDRNNAICYDAVNVR